MFRYKCTIFRENIMPVLKPIGLFNKTEYICLKMHGMNNFKIKVFTLSFYANFHRSTLNATDQVLVNKATHFRKDYRCTSVTLVTKI